MKKEFDIVTLAAGVILVPVVVQGFWIAASFTFGITKSLIDEIKYHKKIKNGLKDGSIVEINGKYYEVEITDHKED